MRYRNAVTSAGILAGCLYFTLHSNVRAQDLTKPVLDIFDFDSRALKNHDKPGSGPDPIIVNALENSPIGKAYRAIRPERSVLIYDCEKDSSWCGQSAFSFQAMFAEAAKIANPGKPDPEGLAKSWYAAALKQDLRLSNDLRPYKSLSDASIQLLAIANRLDLAQWDNDHKRWVGAEVHFAYGPIPGPNGSPPALTLILEFELPEYDRPTFKKLAQTWIDLSTVADGEYSGRLQDALRASGLSLGKGPSRLLNVRSRTNHQIMGGVWQLSQLVLDPKSKNAASWTAFAPANLDDQIKKNVQSQRVLDLWRKAQTVVESGKSEYKVPAELLEKDLVAYKHQDQGMATPAGVCNASVQVRNVLALQQCTWCHTTESNTLFTHLPNRPRYVSTKPSGFLIGKTLHPSLADLYYGDEKVVWPVKVPYTTYTRTTGSTCATPVLQANPPARKFHDVARRTLYLAAAASDSEFKDIRPLAWKFSTFFTE